MSESRIWIFSCGTSRNFNAYVQDLPPLWSSVPKPVIGILFRQGSPNKYT